MKKRLKKINEKPRLYEEGTCSLWDDPYVSKQMLKAHLNPKVESATRKYESVLKSVEWINSQFPSHQYRKLLDLGCGPGIYTELFYHCGYQVTGMDISYNSIEYAISSAQEKNIDIQYNVGDYVVNEFPSLCHLITLIYCDFGVLSDENREILLKKVYDTLVVGGCFVFDVFTKQKYIGKKERNEWSVESKGFFSDKEHLLLKSFYRYDQNNTFLDKYIVIEKEKIAYYHVWEHTFTFEELERSLRGTGFKDISFYGDMTGKECTIDDETICIVARK